MIPSKYSYRAVFSGKGAAGLHREPGTSPEPSNTRHDSSNKDENYHGNTSENHKNTDITSNTKKITIVEVIFQK